MVTRVRRVAVVDDDSLVLRGLRRLLGEAGFEVDTYESGVSFLEALADRPPDCLVLDLHLPERNGFAVQVHLNRYRLRIPVVVVTGDDSDEARSRALSLGAKSYLRKPVEQKVLVAAIEAAISAPPNDQSE